MTYALRGKALTLLAGVGGAEGLLLAVSAQPSTGVKLRNGGTFRIALNVNPGGVDSIDPALPGAPSKGMVLRPTCAQLMAFPGPKPEVSAGYPKRSPDRRTYTFTIRKGFRFNTGEPVTAQSYARAITRFLSPAMRVEDVAELAERFVGGRAFNEGTELKLRGVAATGRTLVFRLTRPWPHLPYELATPTLFCPVPARLPIVAEGAPLPGSGPYYVSRFVPGRKIVLARNRLYRGSRPQHVDRFDVDLTSTLETTTQRVIQGRADFAIAAASQFKPLGRRYGINRRRFFTFLSPESGPRILALNSRRGLVRNNAALRRAVNSRSTGRHWQRCSTAKPCRRLTTF